MLLRLEPITISIDGATATLRPSLLAAYRLHRKHGFPAIIDGIGEGNLSIVADVIECGTIGETYLPLFLRDIEEQGALKLDIIAPALYEFISALIGIEEGDPSPGIDPVKPMTFDQFFDELYAIGTGWLGWSPEATWNATAGEIIAAQRGLIAKLKAIHGGKAEEADNAQPKITIGEDGEVHYPDLPTDDEVRANVSKLRTNARRGRGG